MIWQLPEDSERFACSRGESSSSSLNPANLARRKSSMMPRGSVFLNQAAQEQPRFDLLTLRTIFNEMDTDKSSDISRQEFLNYLRANPKLKDLLLHCNKYLTVKGGSADEKRKDYARELRRLNMLWKEISEEGMIVVNWEVFLDIFRQAGLLLEYQQKDNPKDRMAALVTVLHEEPERMTKDSLDELQDLSKSHLSQQSPLSKKIAEQCEIAAQRSMKKNRTSRFHKRGATCMELDHLLGNGSDAPAPTLLTGRLIASEGKKQTDINTSEPAKHPSFDTWANLEGFSPPEIGAPLPAAGHAQSKES